MNAPLDTPAGSPPLGPPPNSPHWPEGSDFHLPMPPGNAVLNLVRSAGRHPDRPALFYHGATTRYARLLADVEALAGYLQRCGVRRGDRVLLDMQNSPQFVTAFQAILRADAVVVPLNPMNMAAEIEHVIADSGARVALIGDELLDRFTGFAPGPLDHVLVARYADALPPDCTDPLPDVLLRAPVALSGPPYVPFGDAIAAALAPSPIATGDDDLAVMPYTSGTTGRPKACMQPHRALKFTAIAQAKWYRLTEESVLTAFMPLFHVAGMQASMGAGLFAGGALVLLTRWNRDLVAPLFIRHGVTFWSAAPTMIVDVLASERFEERAFEKLTVLTGGGSSMPAAVAEQLHQRHGLHFCEGYGLSETISATHINPLENPKPQCLGIPIFDTFSIVVAPGTTDELPTGETGELLISGPQVMDGYWNRPEADAETFVTIGGRRYLRTGDMAYRDAEGYYFIVDRLKRMINVSGYKVWPAECEALLYRLPAIQECCVIAVADAYRGESVKAFVKLRPGSENVTAEEVIAFARGVMAAYKVPRAVEFVDALPRSGSNKIDWRALQQAEMARSPA